MAQDHQILLYYLYRRIENSRDFVEEHRSLCQSLGLRGRILIGEEGINGTVSGLREATERYRETLGNDPRTAGITFKIDPADRHVFPKLIVKWRPEIVTLGLGPDDVDPTARTGKRLNPSEWLAAMQEDNVVVIDGRNRYESELGRFKGAVCPDIENFREFPDWLREHADELRGRKILTYCTGGIRCEKLSGYLLEEGFEDVSQLEGGIVTYAKDPATLGRDFEGLCYVFDQRIGVEVNFTETRSLISHCEKCGEPCARYRNCSCKSCNRKFFLCEPCEQTKGRLCSPACQELVGNL
ncbi:MAG: rhodanese-related sulfurtransferase [Verrucomicrobia bacterium]|nr:rhodanese-related sulfurtransferase [Verrucomicrobiota bacterium]